MKCAHKALARAGKIYKVITIVALTRSFVTSAASVLKINTPVVTVINRRRKKRLLIFHARIRFRGIVKRNVMYVAREPTLLHVLYTQSGQVCIK